MPAKIKRALYVAWALTLGCSCSWPAGSWEAGASPVFRRVALPAGFAPVTMLQDRSGMIWIGTQTGLVRWDGYQFQRGFGDLARRDDLRTAYISTLCEDDAGRVWAGTFGSGILRLDPRTGAVSVLPAGPHGLSSPQIVAMAPDRKGGLWVSTAVGLNRVNLSTGQVQRDAEQGIPPGLPKDVNQKALLVDRHGVLWAATPHGLFALRAGASSFEWVPLHDQDHAPEDVIDLMEDGAGRLWINTLNSGVFMRDPATGAVQQPASGGSDGRLPSELRVNAMADAGNGEIWFATAEDLVKVDAASLSMQRLRHEPTDPNIPVTYSVGLFRDRSGLMWLSDVELLAATDPAQRAVVTWHAGTKRLGGGAVALIRALLARPDGSLWVAGGHGGIQIVPPDRKAARLLPTTKGRPRHVLPEDPIHAMVEGPDGRIFVSTINDLYAVSAQGDRVERVEVPGMSTMRANALCSRGGRLWIGGENGLNYLELSSREPVAGRAVAGHGINWLACESEDEFLVGTTMGLFRYRPSTGVFDQPWPSSSPGRAGLPAGWVTSTARGRRGHLWVSLYGIGVCRIEPHTEAEPDRVRCLGHKDGIPDGAANAVALDAQGNAWVSTDAGLIRIDADSLQVTPLQQADGVGLQAHVGGAVTTTADGHLVFAGRGLTIVNPAAYRPWDYKAPLVLTSVSDGQLSAGEIRLGPSTRSVQMSFALLDYSAPEQVRYAYRLAGQEEAWIVAPTESRIARYTNIRPGDYTFEVKAQNRTGEWITQRWPLHVEPAWYETPVFRTAVGIAVLLALWALLRVRTQWLVRRAAQLHVQVAERTRELQQRTEQLEASRQELRELGAHNNLLLEEERKRVARELHDELGQQLAAMRMELSVLKARADKGESPATAQWMALRERVDRLTASMRHLVQNLRPPALDGGLQPALDWLAAEYERASGVPCSVEVDPGVRALDADVKTMVFRVAQEALNNVLRHAKPTKVRMALRSDADGWNLRVSDDGDGFEPARPRRGFGLLSMQERAELVGGRLHVDSAPGRGTEVRFHLPARVAGGLTSD